jgi:hypothetical protein
VGNLFGNKDMDYKNTPYFKVGRATELTGSDYVLYRALEIFPGALSWTTLILVVVLSFTRPIAAAYFIIAFDLFWLLKTVYLSMHLRHNWKRLLYNMKVDWSARLATLKHEQVKHMILLPFYKEGEDVVSHCIEGLLAAKYDHQKFLVVLGTEERAGSLAQETAQHMKDRYGERFGAFLITTHPKDVAGEMAGKGSNIAFMALEARSKVLDENSIPYKDVLVSAFDIDTVVYPDYFSCLTWHFLTSPHPYKTSYQPVPFYNNNVWNAPMISRVVAGSSTFWQMMQQERPEKLATFSSHSVPFVTLNEIGFWQRNMVSEDSRIYWNLLMAHNGDYSVTPLSYPVSMDANVAPTLWQTVVNVYKQHLRWMYGAENLPYIFLGFIKNSKIPFWTKIRVGLVQLEGFWSLATNPIMIFLLGWLPVIVGGSLFNKSLLSYNLPILTRNIMTVAMLGLILSAIIYMSFVPVKPVGKVKTSRFGMVMQWILVPFTIITFGAVPGLHAQTRLMLGKYMGFWVTPKHRK